MHVYICTYIHIYTYIHFHIYTYIHIYIYTYTNRRSLETFVFRAETNIFRERLFLGQKLTFSGNVCFVGRNQRFPETFVLGSETSAICIYTCIHLDIYAYIHVYVHT